MRYPQCTTACGFVPGLWVRRGGCAFGATSVRPTTQVHGSSDMLLLLAGADPPPHTHLYRLPLLLSHSHSSCRRTFLLLLLLFLPPVAGVHKKYIKHQQDPAAPSHCSQFYPPNTHTNTQRRGGITKQEDMDGEAEAGVCTLLGEQRCLQQAPAG